MMHHYNYISEKIISKSKIESAYIFMKTIGIIAEFNPFHTGHLHLIEACKKGLRADHVVIVMSGDFVQRGYPSFCDKYTRTQMALSCGADIVFELPVCYATGSAEFFAKGAVSLLNRLGCIDYLCFGSECGSVDLLTCIADILEKEPANYKETLLKELKLGLSYAGARQKALLAYISSANIPYNKKDVENAFLSPNNILGIEYIKALISSASPIQPYSIKRVGQDYSSDIFTEYSSASAIRSYISANGITDNLSLTMPETCIKILKNNADSISNPGKLSALLGYKLILEKDNGFDRFLDINTDLSNKIIANIENYADFDSFCQLLKSKDLAYSRISRCLIHILLGITKDDMEEYTSKDYISPLRVLGMKKSASSLVKRMNALTDNKILINLKNAPKILSDDEQEILKKNLSSSEIYGLICSRGPLNEYKLKQIIAN